MCYTGSLFAPSRLFLISNQHDPCCSKCTVQIDSIIQFVLPQSLLASNESVIQPSDFLILFPVRFWIPHALQMYFLFMLKAKSPHSRRLSYRFFLLFDSTIEVPGSVPKISCKTLISSPEQFVPEALMSTEGSCWEQPFSACWESWFQGDSRAWELPTSVITEHIGWPPVRSGRGNLRSSRASGVLDAHWMHLPIDLCKWELGLWKQRCLNSSLET